MDGRTGVQVAVGWAGVGLGVSVGVAVTIWVIMTGVCDFCACAVCVRAFADGVGVTR